MAGKKRGNSQIGGDKKTRDKVNRRNPRKNKKGGKKRSFRKQSPTMRWLSVNKENIGRNYKGVRNVAGMSEIKL